MLVKYATQMNKKHTQVLNPQCCCNIASPVMLSYTNGILQTLLRFHYCNLEECIGLQLVWKWTYVTNYWNGYAEKIMLAKSGVEESVPYLYIQLFLYFILYARCSMSILFLLKFFHKLYVQINLKEKEQGAA